MSEQKLVRSFEIEPALFPAASLPAELLEKTRVLSLLYDIARELTMILELETLVRKIGERVKVLVDYDLFNVMLLNKDSGRLESILSLRFDERVQETHTVALGEGLCGTAARERKAVRVNQVANDPRYIRCALGTGIQSELVVPLIVKDRVLGVLNLESLKPGAFTKENEEMLTMLASTVAIALENACLYDELRRAEQRKTEDLDRAREVQQLLLPKVIPQISGIDIGVLYEPAQQLGGDFYDFLPYGDGRMAIAVGDVAGKGSAAALLASLGVGILREHAVHRPSSPAEMLADLNGHLQIPGAKGRFIAMAFGVYSPDKRELILANAGFPPPLLVRDRRAVPIDVAGTPLGLFAESTYDSVSMGLKPGDMVVFCSDGVHEQMNALDEEFGIERLISSLTESRVGATAEEVAQNIVREVREYAGENGCAECVDDRTIVVFRVIS
jgi:sigma-B regulation protein RsbU (phosphoserine phosphatase)